MKKPTHLLQPIMECYALLVKKLSCCTNSIAPAIPGLQSSKKRFLSYALAMVGILLFMTQSSYGQEFKDFTIRKKVETRGKMIVAGNTILGVNNLPFNDNTVANQDVSMRYIDIDADGATFSSSSADLVVPNQSNGSVTTCYRVQYAALYWAATLKSGDGNRANINQVKLKLPGATSYTPITGQVIYDAIVSPIPAGNGELANTPYACYADVTNLINSLSSISGTYTVADVLASQGSNGSTGLSAGWTLYVVYEDPTLTMKSFNVFDGFSAIFDGKVQQMDVSGFATPPSGNVDLQMAYASLDGDKTVNGTKLEIDGKEVITPLRSPSNRFFNATIENTNGVQTPRNPSGSNTLGYDTGVLEILGANPAYVKNNQTSTSFTMQVAKGQSDPVFAFFAAYAVDIIAPKIDLTKLVKSGGVDVGGANVNLGQYLTYEISYQSVGNDNVTNFTIKDVLPINITFNPLTDIDLSTAGGATLQSYDPVTRTLIFKIPDASVQVNDGVFTIRLNVRVATDCNSLATACSNVIQNQAFATYQGVINPTVVQEEGSFASVACKLGSPDSTNFLVDISKCTFTQKVILCGASVVLKASDGYASYSWSRNRDGSNPIGTGQTFTATQTGIYYVHNLAPLTCKDVVEEITVSFFGVTNTNPVIPFADKVAICPNDGKQLPYIFLCGANATRSIITGISDASSIVWEKLNETSCPSIAPNDCANESFAPSCWNSVGTGPDYVANTSGQFRVILRYTGGCQSIFYFNVYQNPLNPTYTKKDMICGSPGEISVGGVPTGYEFSLDGTNYVLNSPTFSITTPGVYTVYIKQTGVTTFPCIFTIPAIVINNRQMNVRTFVTQPTCNGVSDASIKLIAENVDPQYYFSVSKGGVLVNSVGPIIANDYTLPNLGAGTYTVNVSTSPANCVYTGTIDIVDPAPVVIQANITKPLTCTDGEVTVTVTGGTPNFNYYVNGTSVSLNDPSRTLVIPITTAGTYDIRVVDLNKCEASTPITINANPKPVYTVTPTNILCHGANTGEIRFVVTNANNYGLQYSIDGGITFQANPVFSNLATGTYTPVLQYTMGGAVCIETLAPITIIEPAAAVSASAGVAELAGCSLPDGNGVNQGGKLRITNPQGGTAPYMYSFDGGLTWVNNPEKNVLPGTYTLKVKDANGCEYTLPAVILDPRPLDPTLAVSPPVFNCDGTATSTVTVTNPGGVSYTYEYYLDNVANTPITNNVFTGVTTGPHIVSVKYKLTSVPTYSNLLFEDFGKDAFVYTATSSPDVPSPGINPAFCWERQITATRCNGNRLFGNGEYTVTSSLRNNPYVGWHNPIDHTAGTPPPGVLPGRYLAVDAGTAIPNNAVLYRKQINDIIPNQPIKVRFYATNLLKVGNTQPDASLTVEVQNSAGIPLSSSSTGGIPKTNGWVLYEREINPGANTTLDFVLRLELSQVNGIDFAVDDIEVYQLPATCITQKDFPIVIDSGKAFAAQLVGQKNVTCAGLANGEITIAAQNFGTAGFEYSINNGATWTTSTSSPVTVSNLAGALYKVIVRPVGSTIATCSIPFDVTISVPTALTLSASVTKQATCTTGATITAIGGGGTPAYQYELRQGTSIITAYSNNGGVFTNVAAGNYTVFVKDANGCEIPVGVAVNVTAPPALTAALATTTDYCYTTANPATLDVTVTGGTGPFTYKLNGNAAISSALTTFSFPNVAPGTHTIVVTDSNNCTATISSIVIAPQIGLTVALINDLTCLADATIDTPVVTNGNGGPYTYTVTHGGTTAAATFPFTASTAGTYVFTVTDSKGCTANSNTITVTPKTTPTITTNKTDITCNGLNNGTITVTAAGGFTSAYTYAIKLSSAATYTLQPTNVFTPLAAGIYDVKVIDSKGCESLPTQVTIVDPTPIAVNATATAFACTTTNTKQAATITVVPTGGTGSYTYSYNNGSSFGSNSTLTVNDNGALQQIRIIVRDANGCLSPMQQIDLAPLNPPTDLTFTPSSAITCSTTSIDIQLTTTNGVLPLTYVISSGPIINTSGVSSGNFTGLTPGTYVFRVTDANGCYYSESHTIAPVTPIAVTATKLTDVDCFGIPTGSARFTVSNSSGGPGSYTVVTSPVIPAAQIAITGNVYTITGLANGTYTFSVTDTSTGCTDFKSVIITQPSAALALSLVSNTNANCNVPTARVEVLAAGGTPNYRYSFVTSATTPGAYGNSPIANLPTTSTSWYAHVIDAKGCTFILPITIAADPTPNVTASVTNQCSGSGSTFQIVAVGSGGLAPYTYTINTGLAPSPANTFTVAAGTYTITATDANGCPATTTVIVNQALTATALLTKDITCSLPQEATIKVDVLGGIAPFGYRVKIGAGTYTGSPIPFAGTTFNYTASGTTGSTYEFEITDANGTPCTVLTNVVTTNTTVPVTATETHVDPTCNGFTDGSIRLTATAGVAPFTYAIVLSPATPASFGAANVFGGLTAGSYNYIVRDAKGCDATGTIILIDPPAIQASIAITDIVCNVNTPGSLLVNITSGGVAPFTYTLYNNTFTQIGPSVSTTLTSHNFTGLTFGDYYITIVDSKGCEFKSIKQRIETPPFLTLANPVITGATCLVGATVQLEVISGGVAPYRFSILGQPSTVSPPIGAAPYQYTFSGLLQGTTYYFQVEDANLCTSVLEVVIPSISTIAVNIDSKTNVTCNGSNNGILNFTASSFDSTVTRIDYEIYNALTNAPISPAISGFFTGTAGGPISGTINSLPAGDYLLRVKEFSGTECSAIVPFQITQPAQPLTSVVASNVPATCNSGALVTLTTTGGTGPYEYAYAVAPAFSTTFASGNVLTLDPGVAGTNLNWNITVRDVNGCAFNLPVTIAKDPVPVIALSVVDKCVAQGTFGITVTATTAGTGAYTISVDGSTFASIPSLSHTVTGLNSGPHTIIIKDANGCTDTETITIDEPLVATPAITALPTCADNDGVITMSGTGGTGTYTYTISPVAGTVTGNVISGLPAGTYTVTMTDTATPTNCTTTAVVTLGAPTPVTFTTATTPALCVGDSNGTITVTLGAGNNNPTYTYEIIAGPQTAVAQSSNIFTGLQPGTYTVRVNSGRGCSTDVTNVIVAPATPLTATATFPANTTCSTVTVITVTAGGGTGSGYLYNFNGLGYTSDPTYTVNDNGSIQTISYQVKDANGCETLPQTRDVNPLNKPTDLDFNISTAPTCPIPTTGVTVTATNGVGALTFAIIQFNGAPTALYPQQVTAGFAVPAIFNNLPVGDYMFQVTDTFGCTYQESYTVAPVTNITVAASATTDVTCFGAGDGTATFKVTDFTSFTAVLTTGTGTPVIAADVVTLTGLAPGTYILQVADTTTGCTDDVSFEIAQPTVLGLTLVSNVNANCNSGAVVTVQGTGGTPNYTYAFVADAVAPIATDYTVSNSATLAVTLPSPNNYDVWVKDANGCTFKLDVAVVMDANPVLNGATFTECPDPLTGTYTFTINTPTGVGPFEYSIGGGFQTSQTFVVNAPGSYDVTVKDKNGCTTTAPALVVIRQPLILTPTVSTPVSCTNNDGVISVSTTGGSGNYEYRIDSGVYPMTTPFTGLASGAHTVYVRDTTTGCEVSASITLQAATPITGFALAKTEVTCNGGSDGTITATMATPAPGVNDNPVYTYTLSGTTTRPAQASPLFSGLAAGTYTVVVTSERGCTATQNITIIEPGQIAVPAPTVVEFGCTTGNVSNLATITVTGVTGGTAPYLNYEFIKNGTPVQFGASNIYTEADLLGGTYSVNVYDSKGCMGTTTAPITIAPFVQLDKVNVDVTRPITCLLPENITVSATTIGAGATNLEYTLVDIDAATGIKGGLYPQQTNTTGNFANLPVANYLITVRNLVTNCEITSVHYVNNPNTFDLTIDNVVDIICFGGTNGSATITLIDRVPLPTNEAGPFTYTLADALGNALPGGNSTAAGIVNLTNLAAGTYTITATLTNSPYCTVSKSFTITGPTAALVIDRTFTAITCVPGNDGSISATATGGWAGGYEFQLERGATVVTSWSTVSNFTALTAGSYTVKVRDSKGCEVFTTVVLNNPTPIAFTTTTINQALQCNGDTNASITVNLPVTGGQGSNYLYTLNTISATPNRSSGPQTSNVFTNLGAGTYTVTVTDGWGCSTTTATPIVITEPTKVAASLVVASTPTCLTDARLTLTATGGTGAYEYSATATGPWTSMTGNTATISVVPGTYRYYVRDANGCVSIVSNDIVIDVLPPLEVKLDVVNAKINCTGDTTGVIVATATGGLGNYVYTLLDSAGNPVVPAPTQLTPGRFTQLAAGTYSVRVTSGVDCQVVSVSEIIEEPLLPLSATAVVTPVTCNGAGNGIITITATGGTGVIKYAISPRFDQFFDTGVFDQLKPGSYDILVQDQNGCYVRLNETITEPLPIFVNTVAGSEVQELCVGDNNAAFDVNITGGVAPYSVSLDNINGTYVTGAPTQTVFNFSGLTGGDHTVYIKDANGCTAEWIVTLDESVNLDPKAAVAYGCDNNAPSNTVTVTVDASITNPADVDYALDGGTVFQASNVFQNVAPGFHTITARHTNGCEKVTASFEVLGFTPLALTLAEGGLNEIVATATGGAGNYQYSFNGGSTFSTNNKLIYYKSGDYTVIVRDANGCEATATRYFEFIDIEIPNVFTPNGDGNNDTWTPTNTINYKDLTISIFDRYGRKIATLREGQGWDGRYNNLELPTGDYWYILKLKNVQDAREFVGHFTLMR